MAAKKCLICNAPFRGRADAITCSDRCRKRLQKVRSILVASPQPRHSSFIKKSLTILVLGLFGVLSLVLSAAPQKAVAATSSNLNFQARLLTNTGAVVPDGTYNIDFKIYNADSTTGTVGTCTGACLWEETRKVFNTQGVSVTNGYFSVNLGSVTSFPAINWDQQLWLTMNIGGTANTSTPTWDGEMQNAGHCIALTAIPYSFIAGQLALTSGANRGTLSFGTVATNPAILLPDASGTVCLQSSASCGFASSSGSGSYIQNSTGGPQSANFNIISAASGSIGAIVHANASQSVDIFDVQDSSTNVLLGVGSDGSLTSSPANAGTITLGTAAQTGQITIGQATTATTQTVSIESGNGTASTQTVNIGAGTSTTSGGKVVNIATGIPGASTTNTVHIGDGGTTTGTVAVTIGSAGAAAHTLLLQGGNGTGASAAIKIQPQAAGDILIGGSAATGRITLGSSSGTNNVLIADGTGASVVHIADTQNAGSVEIGAGMTTGTISLGGTATTGTITIGRASTATTANVNILAAAGTASTQTVNIATGTSTTSGGKVVNIATAAPGTGTTNTVHIGDGGTTTGTVAVTIGSNGAAAHTTLIQGGNGATAIQLQSQGTISIGNNAVAQTIQIGNSTGATVVNVQAGSGNINLLSQVQVGSSTTDATAILSVLDSYNAGTDPTGVAGAMYYNTSLNKFRCYQNSAWADCVGGSGPTVTLQDAYNNSSSPATITTTSSSKGVVLAAGTGNDSTSLFQVQDSGTSVLLGVDSLTTQNLITNPDAENGVTGWSALGSASAPVQNSTQAWQGTDSIQVTTTAAANDGAKYAITLTASTTYSLSAYVRVSAGTIASGSLEIGRSEDGTLGVDSCYFNNQPTVTSIGWTRITCTFTTGDTAPSSSYVYIRQTDATARVFYIDGVQLEPKTNLITNPGFETNVTGWVARASTNTPVRTTTAGQFNSGVAGATISASASASNVGTNYAVSLASNTAYSFSIYAKALTSSITTMEIGRNEGASDIPCSTSQTANTTSFTQFTCNFTTGTVTGSPFVYIKYTTTGSLTFYIDSAQLYTGTNTAPTAFQEGQIALNGVINSPTSFRNQFDNSNAFSVQNSSGASLFNVDSLNSNISLAGTMAGALSQWQSAANTIPGTPFGGRSAFASVVANGYVYAFGGYGNNSPASIVQYSKLNADGSTGTWSTNPYYLPEIEIDDTAVTANGYVYVIGGSTDTINGTKNVFYAKLNTDGTTGPWKTSPNALPTASYGMRAVTANGYVYVLGGGTNCVSTSSALTYYAKFNPDGSIGSWASGTALPQSLCEQSAVVANGYVYIMGGQHNGTGVNTVYYTNLNYDGSMGASWTTSPNSLPAVANNGSAVVSDGYVYVLGGIGPLNSIYYSKLNNDGSVSAWSKNAVSLPDKLQQQSAVTYNGYIYQIGGYNGSSDQNSVYYTSTARIQVGGNIDLVGLQGGTLSDGGNIGVGSTGGSITAGDITAVGNLQVQGQGTFNSLSVSNNFNVAGAASFQNTANSTIAFQIQNATGSPLAGVDTTNSNISLLSSSYVGPWSCQGLTADCGITATNNNVYTTIGLRRLSPNAPVVNGYIYMIGGYDGTNPVNTVEYAKLNADGTTGTWSSTTSLGTAMYYNSTIAYNGFIYVVGGFTTTTVNTVSYGKVNSDGTISAWNTTTVLPLTRQMLALSINNGYLYAANGNGSNGSSTGDVSTLFISRINPDGTLGAWSCQGSATVGAANYCGGAATNANSLPAAWEVNTLSTINGYLYAIGGLTGTTYNNLTYYAKINSDGTTGAWSTSSVIMPFHLAYQSAVALGNSIYILGGYNGNTSIQTANITYMTPNPSTGDISNWSQLTPMPGARNVGSAAYANGYFYYVDGFNGAVNMKTIYFAQADTGNLSVQGVATFADSVNSTSAFLVQNNAGSTIINVDTSTTQNLISADDMEGATGTNGWVAEGSATLTQISTQAWQGSSSLQVATTGAASNGAKYPVALSADTTYAFSVYVKTASTSVSTLRLGYNLTGASGSASDSYCATAQTAISYSWTRLTCSFTTTDATSTAAYIFVNQSDATGRTFYLDGVQLEPKTNLVQNPGFEVNNGIWAQRASSTLTQTTTAGQFNNGVGGGSLAGTAANAGANYPAALASNTTYTFVVYAKANGANFSTFEMGRSDTGSSTSACLTAQTVVTTGFTQFTCSFTTGTTTSGGYVYVLYTDSATRTFYFDSVQLYAGTNTSPTAFQNSQIALNGVVNSPVSFRNQVDSTSAFQIQNATGGSLLNVDSSGSNITLDGVTPGALSPWVTSSNPLTGALGGHTSVTANGYIYAMGGLNGTYQSAVYYAKQNADGSTSGWTTSSNPLPLARGYAASITYNGYVYYIGGTDGSTTFSTVWYARLNTDGSTSGWSTSANPLPTGRRLGAIVTSNGYVYYIGGHDGTSYQSTVLYAKLNADGSVGKWTTSSNPLPTTLTSLSSVVANGYVYAFGGFDGTSRYNTVYYAKLNADGSTGAWSTNANALPTTRSDATAVVSNGYVYLIGGIFGAATNTSYYARLNADGSTGPWIINTYALPDFRENATSVVSNGYIYEIGGINGSAQATVYYASTARVQIGASLDLVGLQSQNLSDAGDSSAGSVGGSLIAGNILGVGALQIMGQASFAQSVSVGNNLTIASSNYAGGSVPLSIDDTTTGINQLQVKDLNASFGSAVTGGAFISRNSYWGEEYNLIRANNTSQNSTTSNNGCRGDLGGNTGSAACAAAASDGDMAVNNVVGVNTSTNSCSESSQNQINGGERITATSSSTASNSATCLEYIGTNTAGTAYKPFAANNLPVVTIKLTPSAFTASANSEIVVGLGASGATTAPTKGMPTNGIFFSNCTTYSTTAPTCPASSPVWNGFVVSGSALVGSVQACTAGSETGDVVQGKSSYLRIEVRANNDIHFFVDSDTSTGITESECGTGVTSSGPGSTPLTMWLQATYNSNVNLQPVGIDIDYARVWQDDQPLAGSDSSSTDTSSSDTSAQVTAPPILPDPNSPDPNIDGSFFNFLGATSEDTVINNNLFVHGTIFADRIKANEIDGLSVFTDQIASLQQRLNASQASGADATSGSTTTTILQTATTTLNLSDGLTVGGDANFHGNTFFYKLVTFVQKTVFNNDVSFNGHISTGGDVPTISLQNAAGITAAPLDNANANLAKDTVSGNDNSGQLSVTFGDDATAGEILTLSFNKAYSSSPNIFLTPTDQVAAGLKYYVTSTAAGFNIVVTDQPAPGTTLNFNYLVIQ